MDDRDINDLERARREISEADKRLVQALRDRFQAVADVAAYKMNCGLPPIDVFRRTAVIDDAVRLAAQCGGNTDLTRSVIQFVVSWMEAEQIKLRKDGSGAFASVSDRTSPVVPRPDPVCP